MECSLEILIDEHYHGTKRERIIIKFLWFPRKWQDRYIWFQKALIHEKLMKNNVYYQKVLSLPGEFKYEDFILPLSF